MKYVNTILTLQLRPHAGHFDQHVAELQSQSCVDVNYEKTFSLIAWLTKPLWKSNILLQALILLYFSRLSAIALKKHSAETHEKYLQVCNICQAAFETYNQLKEHRNTGWDFVKIKILSCPSNFFSQEKLTQKIAE